MPPPIKVELLPHSAAWASEAAAESVRLLRALQDYVVVVHHIGSTAVPGLRAKPIVDLMPVVQSVVDLDKQESVFRKLGYEYWGEYGIPGRRYCTFDEPSTGRRQFQLHCYEPDNSEVERHLAFRDFLRANSIKALEYDQDKHRCQKLHPEDSHAYSAAKAGWIAAHLDEALIRFHSSR